MKRFHVVVAMLTICAAQMALAAQPLPADSIYQLPASLTDHNGRNFRLDERRGKPLLISMFYTSCQFVCPMLVDAMRDTEAQFSPTQREQVNVLIVSFDPARDTVAALKRTAEQRGIDSPHWALARSDAATVRKLAAVLGVQYRALPNGDINHSTALILIDADGRILGRTTQLGNADPAFVKLVQATLNSPRP
jgi:protein SCO1/2